MSFLITVFIVFGLTLLILNRIAKWSVRRDKINMLFGENGDPVGGLRKANFDDYGNRIYDNSLLGGLLGPHRQYFNQYGQFIGQASHSYYPAYQQQMNNPMKNPAPPSYSCTREEKVINPTLELTESKDKEPELP